MVGRSLPAVVVVRRAVVEGSSPDHPGAGTGRLITAVLVVVGGSSPSTLSCGGEGALSQSPFIAVIALDGGGAGSLSPLPWCWWDRRRRVHRRHREGIVVAITVRC